MSSICLICGIEIETKLSAKHINTEEHKQLQEMQNKLKTITEEYKISQQILQQLQDPKYYQNNYKYSKDTPQKKLKRY